MNCYIGDSGDRATEARWRSGATAALPCVPVTPTRPYWRNGLRSRSVRAVPTTRSALRAVARASRGLNPSGEHVTARLDAYHGPPPSSREIVRALSMT